MCKKPIEFIEKRGAQVVIIRGDDQAHVYYPTPPSMARLARIVRRLVTQNWLCLPFSNGWIAQLYKSYHEPPQTKLNISKGAL